MAASSSPTPPLLAGLLVTLLAVTASAYYMTTQVTLLQGLQTDIGDRHRRHSLQLLRIQNDLNAIGLGMRDMLDADGRYPLTAWTSQFDRIRTDLDDALQVERALAVPDGDDEQRTYLSQSVRQFWDALDRTFALAAAGQAAQARDQIQGSLQARQASLSTSVARLLARNNESDAETATRVRGIYEDVQRQIYVLMAATLTTILVTSLVAIRGNRRVFARLAALSDERRELARQVITARESTLREVARELHDDLGQQLTAVGLMLQRIQQRLPAEVPLKNELREAQVVSQATLDRVRGLSQSLHPSIIEDAGLDVAIESYLSTLDRQTGFSVSFERQGTRRLVDPAVAIHVYRILQEALNNVARHAQATRAWVRLSLSDRELVLEVEDHGRGIPPGGDRRGLGLVGMRERATLIGGVLTLSVPAEGGTRVRLVASLPPPGEVATASLAGAAPVTGASA